MAIRFYLLPDDGEPLKLADRLVNEMVLENGKLPQYAGTRQRILVASVVYQDGKPLELGDVRGGIWVFDEEGSISAGLDKAMLLAWDSLPSFDRDDTVVPLRPKASKKQLEKEFRWEPTSQDIDRIIADVWPKRKADRLQTLVATKPKKPRLTWDAEKALNKATEHFWSTSYEIERLKEPSLKSFIAEAQERSVDDPDYPEFYRALADFARWKLEVTRRHRTGQGVWYAIVEVMSYVDGVSEAVERHYERCDSRRKAVEATRNMLAEHIGKYSENIRVEPDLLTDLEWTRRAYPEINGRLDGI